MSRKNPNETMVEQACSKLRLTPEEAVAGYTPIETRGLDGGFFACAHGRGGGRLLVSATGETLWAASCVSPADHIDAFLAGRRN